MKLKKLEAEIEEVQSLIEGTENKKRTTSRRTKRNY